MNDKWISEYLLKPVKLQPYGDSKSLIRMQKERDVKVKFLRDQPEPKIIQIKDAAIAFSINYEIAVLFDTDTIRKLSIPFNKFNRRNHSCTIFKWDPTIKIPHRTKYTYDTFRKTEVPTEVYLYPDGAWITWLTHKKAKKVKWMKPPHPQTNFDNMDKIISAHLFFRNENMFKKWLGEDNYKRIFCDLLG